MMKNFAVYFFALTLLVPMATFAQTTNGAPAAATQNAATAADQSAAFSREGVFGCNRNTAALSGSVGAFSATGGVYVPVADYTTELNTGSLVYLQCVLRGVVDRESESASTALAKQTLNTIATGREGNPLYAVDPVAEQSAEADRVGLISMHAIQSMTDSLTKATGGKLVQAVAKNYMSGKQPLQQIACPYDVDMNKCWSGEDLSDDCTNAKADTLCSAFFGMIYRSQYVDSQNAIALKNMQDCLDWGQGFYCVTKVDSSTGKRTIDTPSIVVEQTGIQAITSGFRKIENANDVDQMVGALYAGLGQQAIAGTGGLAGLSQPIGNQPSYLSQLTAESATGLQNAAANAALQVLAGARQIESQYNQVVTAIANNMIGTIGQLRSVESQCWGLIAYNTSALHVCTSAPTGNTCTDQSGNAIKIATSTQFSQPVIDSQIAPIATTVAQNVQKSNNALSLIDQLVAGVTNTTSLDAQRLALVQLDQLVSQGKLHVSSDVTAAQTQQTAISTTMSALVDSTKTLWADNASLDVPSGTGWCNVNNQAVINYWDQKWR